MGWVVRIVLGLAGLAALVGCGPTVETIPASEVCPANRECCGHGAYFNVCPVGEQCCNDSCGICTPPQGGCIMLGCGE